MYRRQSYRRRRRQNPAVLLILPVILLVGALVFLEMNRGFVSCQKGMKAIQKQDYQKAVICLSEATKKEPDKKAYHVAYGMALVGKGEYEDALAEFEKGITTKKSTKADKMNKKAYRGIGICYFFAKTYEKSIASFDKALEINALEYLNLDIVKYKADAKTNLGEYEEAVSLYTKVIKEEKDNEDMYLKRAYAEAEGGMADQAVSDYDYVIKQNDKNYDAYLGAYTLLMKEEMNEKADSYLQAALKIKPHTVDEKLKYAVVQYYFYGITEEAVASLEALIKEDEPDAYYYLAKISYAEKDYEKVFSYLNRYVVEKKARYLAEAYEMLGRSAMRTKDYQNALKYFETGIACNDAKWTRTLKRDQIAVYEYLSDFQKAYEAANEYLLDFPNDQDVIREVEFIKTRLNKQ